VQIIETFITCSLLIDGPDSHEQDLDPEPGRNKPKSNLSTLTHTIFQQDAKPLGIYALRPISPGSLVRILKHTP